MSESLFFEDSGSTCNPPKAESEQPELIRAGASTMLYRVRLDGKYFMLKTASLSGDRMHEMLRREFELSIGCDHPNIVHVFLFTDDFQGHQGILMEYIEGRTLADFIAENPDFDQRERVFLQLLDAVEYMHLRGLVHNDLKPENILISRNDDTLKLIDFGLSDNDAHYLIKTPGCSPAYAAPELIERRTSDSRSDIYSIGRLADFIFGRRYRRIVGKCCNLDPRRRYRDISGIRKAWKKRKRRPVLAVVTGIGILATLTIVFIAYDHNRTSRQEAQLSEARQQLDSSRLTIRHLQQQMSERETELSSLRDSYTGMRDSIDLDRTERQRHYEVKEAYKQAFQAELERRLQCSLKAIDRAEETSEKAKLMNAYFEDVRAYYKALDRTCDGEDISQELYNQMMLFFEKCNSILWSRL